ncbi:MAG: bifunctional precorrin-2 dehydrogenase/sirohydrochlorin ferrochelatase [Chloroflexi bacterium]|nr:bifunctional precorrin-2 dehydrogenase/sirohydrochlorin ferrochelatase [Chloroflexota bacterium]
MSTYPIILNRLEEQLVVVVGGGAIAEEKVLSLLDAGAERITVISPRLTHALARLAAEARIRWEKRPYRRGDVGNAFMCIAAADDPAINRAVAEEAREARVLVNVVDDPAYCDFYATSVVRRGGFTISIGTDGQMPALAARLRAQLDRGFGPEYAALIDLMRELRPTMRRRFPDAQERRRAWRALAHARLIPLIRSGASRETVWERIESILQEQAEKTTPSRPARDNGREVYKT